MSHLLLLDMIVLEVRYTDYDRNFIDLEGRLNGWDSSSPCGPRGEPTATPLAPARILGAEDHTAPCWSTFACEACLYNLQVGLCC